jgi:8-oxo-dGTP pyrophosphatase MutT (NUDIX family)
MDKASEMLNHPPMRPWENFLHQLTDDEVRYLVSLTGNRIEYPPTNWVSWLCDDHLLGYVPVDRATLICESLPQCSWKGSALVWEAFHWTRQQRSKALQGMLMQHHQHGLLTGWRNEKFSFWSNNSENPSVEIPDLFSVERAGFRYLGMMSHAVHMNGFLPDGRIWCGRRSKSKATDPGLLDNVAAGGLPTDETVLACALRELSEEAGIVNIDKTALVDADFIRTSRIEREGWHDESLRVYNLVLAQDCCPINQDGEVDEFLCLRPSEVVDLIREGQFTIDATASLLQGLGMHHV